MSSGDFKAAAVSLYGTRGWQIAIAAALNVDVSSVRRWAGGQVPVPGPVEAAVRCFLRSGRP